MFTRDGGRHHLSTGRQRRRLHAQPRRGPPRPQARQHSYQRLEKSKRD